MSVMGLAATYNKSGTKYWTTSSIMDTPGTLMCTKLKDCFMEALTHFSKVNNGYPDRVILYRNKSGNTKLPIGQLEIDQLQSVCNDIELTSGHEIKLIYIVVTKNTGVELYAQGFYEGEYKNSIPGTVLDNGIVSVGDGVKHEFYLLSTS